MANKRDRDAKTLAILERMESEIILNGATRQQLVNHDCRRMLTRQNLPGIQENIRILRGRIAREMEGVE